MTSLTSLVSILKTTALIQFLISHKDYSGILFAAVLVLFQSIFHNATGTIFPKRKSDFIYHRLEALLRLQTPQ